MISRSSLTLTHRVVYYSPRQSTQATQLPSNNTIWYWWRRTVNSEASKVTTGSVIHNGSFPWNLWRAFCGILSFFSVFIFSVVAAL